MDPNFRCAPQKQVRNIKLKEVEHFGLKQQTISVTTMNELHHQYKKVDTIDDIADHFDKLSSVASLYKIHYPPASIVLFFILP